MPKKKKKKNKLVTHAKGRGIWGEAVKLWNRGFEFDEANPEADSEKVNPQEAIKLYRKSIEKYKILQKNYCGLKDFVPRERLKKNKVATNKDYFATEIELAELAIQRLENKMKEHKQEDKQKRQPKEIKKNSNLYSLPPATPAISAPVPPTPASALTIPIPFEPISPLPQLQAPFNLQGFSPLTPLTLASFEKQDLKSAILNPLPTRKLVSPNAPIRGQVHHPGGTPQVVDLKSAMLKKEINDDEYNALKKQFKHIGFNEDQYHQAIKDAKFTKYAMNMLIKNYPNLSKIYSPQQLFKIAGHEGGDESIQLLAGERLVLVSEPFKFNDLQIFALLDQDKGNNNLRVLIQSIKHPEKRQSLVRFSVEELMQIINRPWGFHFLSELCDFLSDKKIRQLGFNNSQLLQMLASATGYLSLKAIHDNIDNINKYGIFKDDIINYLGQNPPKIEEFQKHLIALQKQDLTQWSGVFTKEEKKQPRASVPILSTAFTIPSSTHLASPFLQPNPRLNMENIPSSTPWTPWTPIAFLQDSKTSELFPSLGVIDDAPLTPVSPMTPMAASFRDVPPLTPSILASFNEDPQQETATNPLSTAPKVKFSKPMTVTDSGPSFELPATPLLLTPLPPENDLLATEIGSDLEVRAIEPTHSPFIPRKSPMPQQQPFIFPTFPPARQIQEELFSDEIKFITPESMDQKSKRKKQQNPLKQKRIKRSETNLEMEFLTAEELMAMRRFSFEEYKRYERGFLAMGFTTREYQKAIKQSKLSKSAIEALIEKYPAFRQNADYNRTVLLRIASRSGGDETIYSLSRLQEQLKGEPFKLNNQQIIKLADRISGSLFLRALEAIIINPTTAELLSIFNSKQLMIILARPTGHHSLPTLTKFLGDINTGRLGLTADNLVNILARPNGFKILNLIHAKLDIIIRSGIGVEMLIKNIGPVRKTHPENFEKYLNSLASDAKLKSVNPVHATAISQQPVPPRPQEGAGLRPAISTHQNVNAFFTKRNQNKSLQASTLEQPKQTQPPVTATAAKIINSSGD